MNSYEYDYQGHKFTVSEKNNYENARYNNNTRGTHKNKKKGVKNAIKVVSGALVLFLVTGFATKFSETDNKMSVEEGVSITQNYSPSGGIETVIKGEKNHNAVDVLDRMFSDIKYEILDKESKLGESDNFTDGMSRG